MPLLLLLLQEPAPAEEFTPFSINTGMMFWTLLIFGALVAVLWRWGWPALLRTVEEREARIAKQLAEAEKANAEAARLLEEVDCGTVYLDAGGKVLGVEVEDPDEAMGINSRADLAKAERTLERVEKLIELFEPFILHNEHDFVADNIEKLGHALVSDERETFGYKTAAIDWWEYWIEIHIPALRRWTYPLIEGRPLEARSPRKLQSSAPENGDAVKTGTNGGMWQYS